MPNPLLADLPARREFDTPPNSTWTSTFGAAVVKAVVLPCRTGVLLFIGVILVTLAPPLPGAAQTLSAGARDLAFAGMGLSLPTRPPPTRTASERSVVHVHA
jgi:hypothetical protein